MTGIELIAAERQRHTESKGFTAEHDKQHAEGQLAWAAMYYAMPDLLRLDSRGVDLTVYIDAFAAKAKGITFGNEADRIRQLTFAGALIAAEIDRLAALESTGSGKE